MPHGSNRDTERDPCLPQPTVERTGRWMPSPSRWTSRLSRVAWSLLLLSAGWYARGLELPAQAETRSHKALYGALDEFARVIYHVQRDYVDPIDGRQAVYRAISGLLSSLDSHSRFFPKEQAARLRAATTGVTGGIGILISRRGGQCIVTRVLPDSPAARAAVRPGWILLSIGRQACSRLSERRATGMLQGPVGTTVTVRFARPDSGDVSLVLKRVLIRIPAVQSARITRTIGYIRIRVFQPGTAHLVKTSLLRLRRRAPLTGLVLDLRGNPGGLFSEGMALADMFLSKGLLVTRKLRKGRIERLWAKSQGTFTDLDLVILADRKTASAAELAAAALRDNRRALLMGSRTYGKGSIQELLSLPEGSALKLTVGRYYTPRGLAVDGRGLQPDVRVDPGRALALPVPGETPAWARSDAALRTALASLSNRTR